MSWSEVRPGHYQRCIGENEKFIKAIGDRAHASGREHWSITAKASFALIDSWKNSSFKLTTRLRHAWKFLRFEHPSIVSTAEEETLNYDVPNSETLDKWADETFFIHEGKVSADDLTASFKPTPYVTAHYVLASSELILHTAHWRTDGYGALQLLNAYFTAFAAVPDREDPANLPWGQEVMRLVPSIEDVLDLPIEPTEQMRTAANHYISTVAHTKGAVGLSFLGDQSTLPLGTRSARLRLSRSTTEAISEACEARKIRVVAAVHASLAAITYAGAPPASKHKHYTSTMRFGLRPYLPDPYNTSRSASGLYTGGYMIKVPASQSWSENAQQYNDEYNQGVTEDFLMARRQYALNVQDMMRKNVGVAIDGPPPSEIDISSVDDADLLVSPVHHDQDGKAARALEVLDVSIGVETLTRQMYCFVWTFRNQMEFNLVYNEAFYHHVFAMQMLAKLKEVLETELHI